MRLPALKPHERTYFLELVARGSSIKHAMEALYQLYVDAHEYSYNAFVQWVRSEEGKQEVQDQVDGIRDAATERSFANRLSRIDALAEIAEKLISILRRQLEGEVPIFDKDISGELRQYLKQLQEETAPFDAPGKGESVSAFERFIVHMLERKDHVLAEAAEVIELSPESVTTVMGESEPVPTQTDQGAAR